MTTEVVTITVDPAIVVEVDAQLPATAVEVVERGLQGPAGAQGPVGQPTRLPFAAPSLQWNVAHNLGRRPIVALETVGGVEMIAQITHLSDNILVVSFDEPTAGSVKIA